MEDTIVNISGKLTTNEYIMNCYVHIYNYNVMYFVLNNSRNIFIKRLQIKNYHALIRYKNE